MYRSAENYSVPSADTTGIFSPGLPVRYFNASSQILHYTQSEDDRKNIEIALDRVQVILNHINESIREQESRARLQAISKDLWIGQGCVFKSYITG